MDDSDDGRNNSSASSDFFSPISISFFQPNGLNRNKNHQSEDGISNDSMLDRLPPLHDSSWIGARLSPIQSFDKEEPVDEDEEDDEEDERYTAIYHRALHESVEDGRSMLATERTLLLGNTTKGGGVTNSRRPILSNDGVQPLWNGHKLGSQKAAIERTAARPAAAFPAPFTWGRLIRLITGLNLAAMGSHDLYCSREQYGRDVVRENRWRLPCLGPSHDTLIKFGALERTQILQYGAYWRILTSMFLPTSSLEWCLVHLAWSILLSSEDRWYRWAGVYTGSVLTGQLWMLAWDDNVNVLAGCVAWGTCGVLCAAGLARPTHRYAFLVLAIVLIMICLLEQPLNSMLGAVGSTYFGWAISSAGCLSMTKSADKNHSTSYLVRWTSAITAISMLCFPVLWISMTE